MSEDYPYRQVGELFSRISELLPDDCELSMECDWKAICFTCTRRGYVSRWRVTSQVVTALSQVGMDWMARRIAHGFTEGWGEGLERDDRVNQDILATYKATRDAMRRSLEQRKGDNDGST